MMITKTIYSRWLAFELRKKGHKIVRTAPNPQKPEFDLWVFEVDSNFDKDLHDITKNRREKK